MTFGPAYDDELDSERVLTQMEEIKELMLDSVERTLADIEHATGYPQASISAQLRHLRKPKFGRYRVPKRRESGTWFYRLLPPEPQGQVGFCFGKGTSE